MPGFEDQVQNIVSVAAQIARAQNVEPDATVLENASPSLILSGYDDEGSPYYALTLEIPIQTYVQIEHSRDSVEKLIFNRNRPIIRRYPGSWVSEVIVTPVLSTPALPSPRPGEGREQTEELASFWQTGFFRLFISHTYSQPHSKLLAELPERLLLDEVLARRVSEFDEPGVQAGVPRFEFGA